MRRALVLALLLVTTAAAHADTFSVSDYVATLRRWRAYLVAGDVSPMRTEATAYTGAIIQWSGGTFRADDSLILEIQKSARGNLALIQRIDLTILELQQSGVIGEAPDPNLLRQVAAEQKIPELVPGGAVTTTMPGDSDYLAQFAEAFAKGWRWLKKILREILEWIFDIFRGAAVPGGTPGMRWLVIAVTIAIALLIVVIAVQVVRRARRAQNTPLVSSEPAASKRDDDPLSRGATEWERYAAQLAAAGRFREAIRAWYHAVLVTSYNTGVLHFRKGRTNWEYVATLAPSLPWRPEMIELTRRFEAEWYGADQSTPDALDHCSDRAQRILTALRGDA